MGFDQPTIHASIDFDYGADGDARLASLLRGGLDANAVSDGGETLLHVAVRRRRLEASRLLLEAGARVNVKDATGKTPFVHAARRQFWEVAALLLIRGADTAMGPPDQLAVAVGTKQIEEARRILREHPGSARTGNPEEDRLLADIAGRPGYTEAIGLLLDSGADVSAVGLDTGTPLHVAAWFGQPENARLLLDAGAPLEVFDKTHESSPLGWAVHGSRFSGGADERQDAYVATAKMLLDSGALMVYPDDTSDAYYNRLLGDASTTVARVLRDSRQKD